jgi:hypothetical protein
MIALKDRRHDELRLEAANISEEMSRPDVAINHRSLYWNVCSLQLIEESRRVVASCANTVFSPQLSKLDLQGSPSFGSLSGIVSHQEALSA